MRNLRNIIGGGNTKKSSPAKKTRYHDSKDPNAMDVDQLSKKERIYHQKNRLCFHCHERGHRANNPNFHLKEKGKGKLVRRKTPDDEDKTLETSKIEEISDE